MSMTLKVPDRLPSMPVLEGLSCLNFSQSMIAEQVGVPQQMVSRWYRAERGIEPEYIFFLTALLGLIVRAADEGEHCAELDRQTKMALKVRANAARSWLHLQNLLNEELPEEARQHALALEERQVERLTSGPRHTAMKARRRDAH